MIRSYSLFPRLLAVTALLFTVLVGAKCKDDCKDIICEPCPSSKLVVRYEDSTGACPASFHAGAWVIGVNPNNNLDTIYKYNLSDSCTAAFLIQENIEYHVVSGSWADTVLLGDFDFQPGVPVTECCLCYPLEHVNVWFNGDSSHVEFPEGAYENAPVVRTIN
jgi:hypothetical protein